MSSGNLWSTALATCGVLGISDDATCNNTFVSNGGAGGVYTYQQCYWSNGKCVQNTANFCPYDKDTYGKKTIIASPHSLLCLS